MISLLDSWCRLAHPRNVSGEASDCSIRFFSSPSGVDAIHLDEDGRAPFLCHHPVVRRPVVMSTAGCGKDVTQELREPAGIEAVERIVRTGKRCTPFDRNPLPACPEHDGRADAAAGSPAFWYRLSPPGRQRAGSSRDGPSLRRSQRKTEWTHRPGGWTRQPDRDPLRRVSGRDQRLSLSAEGSRSMRT